MGLAVSAEVGYHGTSLLFLSPSSGLASEYALCWGRRRCRAVAGADGARMERDVGIARVRVRGRSIVGIWGEVGWLTGCMR